MSYFGIFLIAFGAIIIKFPEALSYLIGGFFVFIGVNIVVTKYLFSKKNEQGKDYVSFGKYKIYKD